MRWKATIVLIFCWGCNEASPVVQPTPPPGSTTSGFSLTGTVKDTAFRELAGARIEIIEGFGTGTSALTDRQGRFLMPGPFFDTITVKASHEGHVTATKVVRHRVGSAAGAEVVYLWLESTMPTADIAGDYLADVGRRRSLHAVARCRTHAQLHGNSRSLAGELAARVSGAAERRRFLSVTSQEQFRHGRRRRFCPCGNGFRRHRDQRGNRTIRHIWRLTESRTRP